MPQALPICKQMWPVRQPAPCWLPHSDFSCPTYPRFTLKPQVSCDLSDPLSCSAPPDRGPPASKPLPFQVSDTHGYQVFLIWSPLHRPHLVPALGPSPSTLPALKPYLLWHPHSYPRCWVLPPRPQVRSSEPRSPLKLTSEADPLYLLPKMPDHYKLPNPQLGKDAHSRKHSIVPQPINHLTPTFHQEFSLSWGFKTWLLTHENCRLSLVCWEVVSLCSQCPRDLCSLFLINSLPSEMLCIWKFFSNLHWDCLNVRPAPILHRHTVISFVVTGYCLFCQKYPHFYKKYCSAQMSFLPRRLHPSLRPQGSGAVAFLPRDSGRPYQMHCPLGKFLLTLFFWQDFLLKFGDLIKKVIRLKIILGPLPPTETRNQKDRFISQPRSFLTTMVWN